MIQIPRKESEKVEFKISFDKETIESLCAFANTRGGVAVVSVPEYPVKPVACKGRYYKRIGNANHVMTIGQVVDSHLRTFNPAQPADRRNVQRSRAYRKIRIRHKTDTQRFYKCNRKASGF